MEMFKLYCEMCGWSTASYKRISDCIKEKMRAHEVGMKEVGLDARASAFGSTCPMCGNMISEERKKCRDTEERKTSPEVPERAVGRKETSEGNHGYLVHMFDRNGVRTRVDRFSTALNATNWLRVNGFRGSKGNVIQKVTKGKSYLGREGTALVLYEGDSDDD